MSKNQGFDASRQQIPDQNILPKWAEWFFPTGILMISTVITYFSSLWFPFQFDDIANITRKYSIRFDNPLGRWWGSTRWVGEWINTINYKIGGIEPFSYRLFNLIQHMLAGLIVFYLILSLFAHAKRYTFLHANRLYLAFTTAGLFLLHPAQTQTISYVIQARLEGLATMFVLLTIFLFVRAEMAKETVWKIVLYTLFFASMGLSCGTKELVVVLPALLILIDWFFLSEQDWEKFKPRLVVHVVACSIMAFMVLNHLGDRFARDVLSLSASTGNNRGNILTDGAFDIITPGKYFMSEFKVILHYFWIFICPIGLSVEYDWKLAPEFWSFQVIIPLIILLSLLLMVAYSAIKKERVLFTFGVLWFLISIAPRSTIIPSPELVCDYKTYLASFGMMIILAYFIVASVVWLQEQFSEIPKLLQHNNAKIALLFLLLAPLSYYSIERNKIWETSVSFWTDGVKNAPNKARCHNNLGVALSEVGRVDEAIVAYNRAIELDRVYSDPLSNLAVAYSMKGEIDKAIDCLKMAIHIAPNYPEAYNNLGTLLLQQKEYAQAEQVLHVAVRLRPYYGKAFYNLARMHEELKNHEKSWEYLKKATEGDLDSQEIIYKLGQMSLKVQKIPEAIQCFERVIQLGAGSQEPNVWFNLANAYFLNNDFDRAQAVYERLVRDNPTDGRYLYNLAETYYTKKDFAHALDTFKQAVSLPKSLSNAHFRLVNCLEQLNHYDDALGYLEQLASLSDIPEDFMKTVKEEQTRLEIQSKINTGNGSIRLGDLKQAVGGFDRSEQQDGTTTGTRVIHIRLPQTA